MSIGCHWCKPHTNHAAYPLLAYNDEQHTCDKDNAICSIGTSQLVNKNHTVVVNIPHDCYGWHCPNNEAACKTSSPMAQHGQIIRAVVKIHTATPNRTVRSNKLQIGKLCHCHRGKSPAEAIIHCLRRRMHGLRRTAKASW